MMDPFAILSVDKTATKREIITRVTAALREKRHDARLIAEAQKELFDPVSRAAAEFTHVLDTSGCIGGFKPEVVSNGDAPELEMFDYVDEEGTAES